MEADSGNGYPPGWGMLLITMMTVKHGTLRVFIMISTSGFLAALECTKFVFGREGPPPPLSHIFGSAPGSGAAMVFIVVVNVLRVRRLFVS